MRKPTRKAISRARRRHNKWRRALIGPYRPMRWDSLLRLDTPHLGEWVNNCVFGWSTRGGYEIMRARSQRGAPARWTVTEARRVLDMWGAYTCDEYSEVFLGQRRDETLSTGQAAQLLGVKSSNTVKNWLEGGSFPGARRTKGGHWRFPKDEVLKAKEQMAALARKNHERDLAPTDVGDDAPELPLL